MSSIATLNGVQYIIPAYNDTGWAQGTGNLSQYFAAIASATLQPTGGSFTLTADVDFGASFGLKALFLKTETANPASAGVIRLASADTIKWRNNANGADIALSKDTSDNLQWNATKVLLSGAVVNADINASAAIAYSKLALTGAILNADLAGSIAYSKLVLTASVVNADIASAAAIAVNKLAAVTASRVLASDASGFVSASSVTSTTLAFLDATSSIQTQINTKQATLTAGQLPGTATNDDASAGNVGEYVESVVNGAGAGTSLTSATWIDVTSIPLTAGDYDIVVNAGFNPSSGSATFGRCSIGVSSTSGNSTTGLVLGSNWLDVFPPNPANSTGCGAIASYRVKLSGNATYYLKMNVTWTTGTMAGFGRISARRRR